jgi:hypothetical protein
MASGDRGCVTLKQPFLGTTITAGCCTWSTSETFANHDQGVQMKRPNSYGFASLGFVMAAIAVVPASMAQTGSDRVYHVAKTSPPGVFLGLRTNPTSGFGQHIAAETYGRWLKVVQRQEPVDPNTHQFEWECADIKIIPADGDKDPVSKVSVFIKENEKGVTNSEVKHTAISGNVSRRSEQYEQYRFYNDVGGYEWRGYSPALNLHMLGKLYFLNSRWYYHEALRQGTDGRPGKLIMFMDSVCQFID